MFEAAQIHCGVSGWNNPQWAASTREVHPLEHLAGLYDAVEIKQCPRPEIARLWLRKVDRNQAFQFSARLPKRFTAERILDTAEVASFTEGLRPLHRAGRLACLLAEFPWSFRLTEENREFFIKLRRTFHEFPIVAEMRHASWMADEAIGTFIDYHVGFCNIDQPAFTKSMPPTGYLTSPVGYVRLHGRKSGGHLYTESELEEWQARIEKIRPFAKRIIVIANNGTSSKAAVNALQIQSLLNPGRKVRTTRELVRKSAGQLAPQQASLPLSA